MLGHMILMFGYIIWCDAHSCALEVTMTMLRDCPASLGNIFSPSQKRGKMVL